MGHTCYTAEMRATTSAAVHDDDHFINLSVPRSYIQPSRGQEKLKRYMHGLVRYTSKPGKNEDTCVGQSGNASSILRN